MFNPFGLPAVFNTLWSCLNQEGVSETVEKWFFDVAQQTIALGAKFVPRFSRIGDECNRPRPIWKHPKIWRLIEKQKSDLYLSSTPPSFGGGVHLSIAEGAKDDFYQLTPVIKGWVLESPAFALGPCEFVDGKFFIPLRKATWLKEGATLNDLPSIRNSTTISSVDFDDQRFLGHLKSWAESSAIRDLWGPDGIESRLSRTERL